MARTRSVSKRKSPEIPESVHTPMRPSKKAKKAAPIRSTSFQSSQDVSAKSIVYPAVVISNATSNANAILSTLQSTGYFIPLFMNCLIL